MRPIPLAATALLFLACAAPDEPPELVLDLLSVHRTGHEGGAEIAAWDPGSRRLFVVDSGKSVLRVLDLADPSAPELEAVHHIEGAGTPNSVAVHSGRIAVALSASTVGRPGVVVLLDPDGRETGRIEVGAGPDMLTFTPDGRRLVVACEGEPDEDYRVDPEGAIAVVELDGGHPASVQLVGLADAPVTGTLHRACPPGTSLAADLEPEYVAVAPDGRTAYATLQENDAVAVIDLESLEATSIHSLGALDHSVSGQGIDPSDRDGGRHVGTWPARGLFQPDSIVCFESGGVLYLATADEGDARDRRGYSEVERVGKLELDRERFADRKALRKDDALGRLQVSKAAGDEDGDGDVDTLHAFGARTLSIWTVEPFRRVAGSGERLSLLATDDDRSDEKGPEPEGLAHGELGGRHWVFVGLERPGGIAVFDVTDPREPRFAGFRRDEDEVGPEGVLFVRAEDSPDGRPLLVVCSEVSGSVAIYRPRVSGGS